MSKHDIMKMCIPCPSLSKLPFCLRSLLDGPPHPRLHFSFLFHISIQRLSAIRGYTALTNSLVALVTAAYAAPLQTRADNLSKELYYGKSWILDVAEAFNGIGRE